MGFLQVLIDYKWVIIFYSIIVFIVVRYRKKFEIEAKFIALYRMKLGLKFMDNFSKTYPRIVKVMGDIGIYVCFAGMAFIFGYFIKSTYDLFAKPATTAGVSILIPGIPIPGSPITVPLYGILAIFIIASVHEFSHGVVARRYKVPVRNTGIVFFGPLIGAFVEPDEKKLAKIPKKQQLAMYAAGSWSNIVLAIFAALIMVFALQPLWVNALDVQHTYIVGVADGFPAQQAGLHKGDIITAVNGVDTVSIVNLTTELDKTKPGDTVIISTSEDNLTIVTTAHPDNQSMSIIGVDLSHKFVDNKQGGFAWVWFYLSKFMFWLWVISLGIGLANLLPVSIFDGGRMFKILSETIFKDRRKSLKFFSYISSLSIFLLLINVLVPIIRTIF